MATLTHPAPARILSCGCYTITLNVKYRAHMSRNYKFRNPEGMYFISFAVVGWLDVGLKK